jgi:hypothetical protein
VNGNGFFNRAALSRRTGGGFAADRHGTGNGNDWAGGGNGFAAQSDWRHE